jgi:hypothetical protein
VVPSTMRVGLIFPCVVPSTIGSSGRGRQPVWSDSADVQLCINVAAKARLRKLRQGEGQTVVNGERRQKKYVNMSCISLKFIFIAFMPQHKYSRSCLSMT